MKYSLPSIIGCSQHRPRKDLRRREAKKTISAYVLSLVLDSTLGPWLCSPPRYWEFLGNNDRQRYTTQVQTQTKMKSGIHPCWDVITLNKRKKQNKTLKARGNSQHGWSLLQAGMKVSSAERKLWGKESSHSSLHSAMTKRNGTTSQYSTYSDVRPNVGGRYYGAPSCPVWCESLNRWQDRLHRTQTQSSTPPIFLCANTACQTKLLTFGENKLPRQVRVTMGNVSPNTRWHNSLLKSGATETGQTSPSSPLSVTQISFSHSQVMTRVLAQFSQACKSERAQLLRLPAVQEEE